MNVCGFSPAANVALFRQSRVFSWNVAEVSQELGRRFASVRAPFAGATATNGGRSDEKASLCGCDARFLCRDPIGRRGRLGAQGARASADRRRMDRLVRRLES